MSTITVQSYLEDVECLEEKIAKIDALIDAMLDQSLAMVGKSGTFSYSMDDGQIKVATQYRSMDEVMKGVDALEKIRQRYINRINGPITVLRSKLNG